MTACRDAATEIARYYTEGNRPGDDFGDFELLGRDYLLLLSEHQRLTNDCDILARTLLSETSRAAATQIPHGLAVK
jgi:hypothetical protein